MSEYDKEKLALLLAADVGFFDEEGMPGFWLNMNDIWAWATADAEHVAPEEVDEVNGLFMKYGFCGLYYWVSRKNSGQRSEFYDVNRAIEFVEHEEELIKVLPGSSARAYTQLTYEITGTRKP